MAQEAATVLFGGIEGGPSQYASAGFKRNLPGFSEGGGFVLVGRGGAGRYPEVDRSAPGGRRGGRVVEAALVAGYEWRLEAVTLAITAGPEVAHHWSDPARRPSDPTRWGLAGAIDVWSQPSPSLLLQANFAGGTAESHVWGRLAAGWKVFDGPYLGPEASFYVKPGYTQERVGVHLSEIAWRSLRVRASGGWQWTAGDRSGTGAYVGISAYSGL